MEQQKKRKEGLLGVFLDMLGLGESSAGSDYVVVEPEVSFLCSPESTHDKNSLLCQRVSHQIDVHGVKVHAFIEVIHAALGGHHHILHDRLFVFLHEPSAATTAKKKKNNNRDIITEPNSKRLLLGNLSEQLCATGLT